VGPCIQFADDDNRDMSLATPEIRLLGRFLVVRGGRPVTGQREGPGQQDTLDSLRQLLADELGIDPSSDVDTLRTSLLGGPTPARPAQPTAPRARVELPFVGRAAQLADLLRTVRSDVDGDGAAAWSARPGRGSPGSWPRSRPGSASRSPRPARSSPSGPSHGAWPAVCSARCSRWTAHSCAVPQRSAGVLADLLPGQLDAEADMDERLDARTRRALIVEGGLRWTGCHGCGPCSPTARPAPTSAPTSGRPCWPSAPSVRSNCRR
jgi:hypothetical protein